MLDMSYDSVARYETSFSNDSVCRGHDNREQCDSLTYGCLIKGLRGLHLWPKRPDPATINMSVATLATKLGRLHCYALPGSVYPSHQSCTFTPQLKQKVDAMNTELEPSGVLPSHLTHMRTQREK